MPLITLPKDAVDFEEAIKLLEEYPDDKPAYIRLNVLIKDYLAPDCNERASSAVKGKNCKFCYIKPNREKHTSEDETKHISIQEMQEMSPLEIAKLYFKEAEGEEMDEELCELMNSVVQKVKEKSNLH